MSELKVFYDYEAASQALQDYLKTQFQPGQPCQVQLCHRRHPDPTKSVFDPKAREGFKWTPDPELTPAVVVQVSGALYQPGVVVKVGKSREMLVSPRSIFFR